MHKMIPSFGTDGVRAKAGQFPFDHHSLYKLGRAIGVIFRECYGTDTSLLIAQDTRISADYMKANLLAGLLSEGVRCVDAHIAPTPCLIYGVKYLESYALGIVISASHNSYEDNGIKIVNKQGKIDKNFQERIIKEWHADDRPVQHFGVVHTTLTLISSYRAHLAQLFSANFLKNTTIIIDCAHGAFSYSAPAVLQSFGATVISINASPNGYNINDKCGSVCTDSVSSAMSKYGADIGIALDGDGDRVTIIDRYGVPKDGDDIMSVLINHPLYSASECIVGTLMTNKACEEYIISKNKVLHRAFVGDSYVAEACKHHGALIGAESSGHIITYDHIQSGDGLFVALRLLEYLKQMNTWSINSVQKYPQINKKIRVSQRLDLHTAPIATIIKQAEAMVQQGRLVVRYSGTEPVLRTMVEAPEYQKAKEVSDFLLTHLTSFFM